MRHFRLRGTPKRGSRSNRSAPPPGSPCGSLEGSGRGSGGSFRAPALRGKAVFLEMLPLFPRMRGGCAPPPMHGRADPRPPDARLARSRQPARPRSGSTRCPPHLRNLGRHPRIQYISPNSFPRPAFRAVPSVGPVGFWWGVSGESRLLRPETPKTRGSGSRLANTPVPFRLHSGRISISLERGGRFPRPRSGKCRK